MVVFPPRYASSPAGLVAPETELDCLMVVHEGQEIVEHLRAAIGEKFRRTGPRPRRTTAGGVERHAGARFVQRRSARLRSAPGNRAWTMGSYADAWVAHRSVPRLADPGVCTRCGTRLSIYRGAEETTCAPCGSKVTVRRHPT